MAEPPDLPVDENSCEDSGFDEMPVEVETELIQYEPDEEGETGPPGSPNHSEPATDPGSTGQITGS